MGEQEGKDIGCETKTRAPLGEEAVLRIFRDCGAILTGGHYVLAGGECSGTYVEKTLVTNSSAYSELLCEEIALRWADDDIDVVVGPAFAGIKIAALVALGLYHVTRKDVPSMYTEKDSDGIQVLEKNRDLIAGKRVLVVDDVGTTGGSIKMVIEECRCAGAIVVGCHIMIDRSGGRITAGELGVEKYRYLARLDVVSYPEGKCPYCERKEPIDTRHGQGKRHLRMHPEKAAWGKQV